jgi:hypothetical protein
MKTVATVVAVIAASACVADAHTYLTQPLAEFKGGASKSSWVAEFSPPWSGKFKTGAQYAAVAPGKGFKNLRSFLESKGPTCGNSLSSAKPKPIPSDGMVKFASTLEHPGPCEIWLDETMAFHSDDCEKQFGSSTSVKVNFSACKGSCMLRFYWLGLQDSGTRWQSYKNCVPLGGGKSRSMDDEDDEAPRANVDDVDAASFMEQEKERQALEAAAFSNETDANEYTFQDLYDRQ